MPTPKYYLLDENKNLIEGFDKEGFLGLLEQAIEQGTLENIDEDSAVASKLRSALNGSTHHIEFLTQAEFNQLVAQGELQGLTYYFITDDTTAEGLEASIDELKAQIETLNNQITALQNKIDTIPHYEYDITLFYHSDTSDGIVCFRMITNETLNNLTDVLTTFKQEYGILYYKMATGYYNDKIIMRMNVTNSLNVNIQTTDLTAYSLSNSNITCNITRHTLF